MARVLPVLFSSGACSEVYAGAEAAVLLQASALPPIPGSRANAQFLLLADSEGHDYFPPWPTQLKRLSMKEANLKCSDITTFAYHVPKLPKFFVEQVKNLPAHKHTTFNFKGSGSTFYSQHTEKSFIRRKWIVKFAQKHFSDNDILDWTDANSSYVPLGAFDRSGSGKDFNPRQTTIKIRDMSVEDAFQGSYYQDMKQSWFTLCPGGDNPYSYRFYEAILARSVPLIQDQKQDWRPPEKFWLSKLGYQFVTVDQYESEWADMDNDTWMKRWHEIADNNYDLFLNYQTFHHGDNVLEAYGPEASLKCDAHLCPNCTEDLE